MRIEMFVDELASLSSTPESEYEEIELDLRRYIFGDSLDVIFKCGVLPDKISPSTQLYVIDFGALACYGSGSEWKADLFSRQLIRSIEDYPDTLFVLWSTFTVNHYQYIACEDKGLNCWSDYNQPKNLYLWHGYDWEENLVKIRNMLGLPEPVVDVDKYIAKKLKGNNDDILSTDPQVD